MLVNAVCGPSFPVCYTKIPVGAPVYRGVYQQVTLKVVYEDRCNVMDAL